MRLLIATFLLAISYAQTDTQRFLDDGAKRRLLSTTLRSKVLRQWGQVSTTFTDKTEAAFTWSIYEDSDCQTDPVFETSMEITSGIGTCAPLDGSSYYELLKCVGPGVIASQLYYTSDCTGDMDAEDILTYGQCDEQAVVTWGPELGCLPELPEPCSEEDNCLGCNMYLNHDDDWVSASSGECEWEADDGGAYSGSPHPDGGFCVLIVESRRNLDGYIQNDCIYSAPEMGCEDDDERAILEAASRGFIVPGCSVVRDFTKGIDLCDSMIYGTLAKEICPDTCGMCG